MERGTKVTLFILLGVLAIGLIFLIIHVNKPGVLGDKANAAIDYIEDSTGSTQTYMNGDNEVIIAEDQIIDSGTQGDNACVQIGCYSETEYIGSQSANFYYDCSCPQASQISKENHICFGDESEAIYRGYRKANNCDAPLDESMPHN